VVAERPSGVTIPELPREMNAGMLGNGEGSRVERAVRELVGSRLRLDG
jgi:hypothetical protein